MVKLLCDIMLPPGLCPAYCICTGVAVLSKDRRNPFAPVGYFHTKILEWPWCSKGRQLFSAIFIRNIEESYRIYREHCRRSRKTILSLRLCSTCRALAWLCCSRCLNKSRIPLPDHLMYVLFCTCYFSGGDSRDND